jgi:hypothetical protein
VAARADFRAISGPVASKIHVVRVIVAAGPCGLAAGVPSAGPYAGTFIEASTSKSPTIQQTAPDDLQG